jgi:hypothetical protein
LSRILGIGLAAVLAVGVLVAIVVSYTQSHTPASTKVLTVHGVIGSEKLPFFQDPDVIAEFRARGYDVEVDTAGSRQIATTVDLSKYDFAFPAGQPAAVKIQQDHKAKAVYVPFFTPMAIATFVTIGDLLKGAGVATSSGGVYTLDVNKFLALVAQNKRWTDLPNNTAYPAGKSILITSTNPTTSNSAAMYLAITSYVANANNVVENPSQAQAVLPKISPLFLRQGFTESSSEAPFDDYLSIGIGKSPLVMIYESQFVARAALHDGSIRPDMVLLYPRPTVLSKHTFVPLTAAGDRLGRALTTDQKLRELETDYGFRTGDPGQFQKFASANRVAVEDTILDTVDPPSYEILEYMISRIEQAYKAQDSGP